MPVHFICFRYTVLHNAAYLLAGNKRGSNRPPVTLGLITFFFFLDLCRVSKLKSKCYLDQPGCSLSDTQPVVYQTQNIHFRMAIVDHSSILDLPFREKYDRNSRQYRLMQCTCVFESLFISRFSSSHGICQFQRRKRCKYRREKKNKLILCKSKRIWSKKTIAPKSQHDI